jgi:hypothetical protein
MMKNILLQILQTLQNMFKVLCNGSFIINIISFIVLSFIIIRFYLDLSFDIGLLSLIISFLIFFVLTDFVLNKFEYSKNIYVGFIQKFLIYIIISITGAILLFYILKLFYLIPSIYCSSGEASLPIPNVSELSRSSLVEASGSVGVNGVTDVVKVTSDSNNPDKVEFYNFKISKRLVDNSLKNVADASTMVLDKIAPNLGVGAAAGTAASAALKITSGMAPVQRLAVIGATAAVTAAGTKVGLDVASAISKNIGIEEAIKNSPHAEPLVGRVPSPDLDFILSPLEKTSPLQDLLMYSIALDIIILILLISILLLIFNRYIVKYNLTFINYLIQQTGVNKYIPIKIINWFNKKINAGIDYNSKLVLFIFILNSIFIFLFVLLKICISSELLINIDSYINVHNYIHGKDNSF